MIRDSGLLFWATLYMSLIGQEKKHYVFVDNDNITVFYSRTFDEHRGFGLITFVISFALL